MALRHREHQGAPLPTKGVILIAFPSGRFPTVWGNVCEADKGDGASAIGVPSALGFGIWSGVAPLGMDILSFFDFVTNSVLMPIVAILTCLMICYVMRPKDVIDEVALTGKFKLARLFKVMIYIAPVLLLVILAFAIFEAFGITFGGLLKF